MDKDPLEIAYQDLNIHDIVEGRWRNIKYINPDARYLGNARDNHLLVKMIIPNIFNICLAITNYSLYCNERLAVGY